VSNKNTGGCVEAHLIADYQDNNLLLFAAEQGRNDIVEILLKMGIETSHPKSSVNAQALAWSRQHFDIILTFAEANLTYPRDIDVSKCPDSLGFFIKVSDDMHEAVKAINFDKISEIISQYPNLRHFYNCNNESAPKIALDHKLIDVYKFLIKNKVFLGRHEAMAEIWNSLSESDRIDLREIHFEHSIDMPEKHIHYLTINSQIAHDDSNPKGKLSLAQYAFEILNENPLIRIIFMIVAASKNFKILFDFISDSVHVVDPTADDKTKGLFYLTGRIYISAKHLVSQNTEHETFGTLAHELCHYAMNLVFKNMAKPYYSNDQQARDEFEEISNLCQQKRGFEQIIDLVYDCYPKNMQHAELIVRVPHLLALYQYRPAKLNQIRTEFCLLFDFYEKKVVPEMQKLLPKIDAENQIDVKNKKIFKFKTISIITIIFSIISIIVGVFVMRSIFFKPTYNFKDLTKEQQIKVRNGLVNYKDVNLKLKDLFPKNSSAYEILTSDHISKLINNEELNFSSSHLHYLDELVHHNWYNMSKKLQRKILHSNVTFQGEKIKFRRLYKTSMWAFISLTSEQIIHLLEGKEFKISQMTQNQNDFYIERMFFQEDIYAIYYHHMNDYNIGMKGVTNSVTKTVFPKREFIEVFEEFQKIEYSEYLERIKKIKQKSAFKNLPTSDFKTSKDELVSFKQYQFSLDDIVKSTEDSKIFILSAEGGMGKTVTFEELTMRIKMKFPLRWVSYIDLKDHIWLYEKYQKLDNVERFLEEILGLGSENEFEAWLFDALYLTDNVVLLWNGFDEISPTYSEFILEIINSVRLNSSNIQYICTRPLYSDFLSDNLNTFAWTLVPFDQNDQHIFLSRYFELNNLSNSDVQNYTENIKSFLSTLKSRHQTYEYASNFDSPLMLRMIAEIVYNNNGILKADNLYKIYEEFVSKKVEIWQEKSIFAKSFINNLISKGSAFNLIKFLQKHALKSELSQNFYQCMNKLEVFQQKVPKDLPRDEISRMGILYTSREDDFRFAHKTFAEFFVAQYLVENIYKAGNVERREAELRIELFQYISENFLSGYNAITNFIKSFLETQDEYDDKSFSPMISDVLRTTHKRLFYNLLNKCTWETFDFLLNFFKKDQKVLNCLLHIDADETIYNAANNFFHAHSVPYMRSCLRFAIKTIEDFLTPSEYKKLVNGKNQKGIKSCDKHFLCEVHAMYCSTDIVTTEDFFEKVVLKDLNRDEIRELFTSKTTPLMYAILKQNYMFDYGIIYKIAKNLLSKDEMKKFFLNFISIYAKDNLVLNKKPLFVLKRFEKLSTDSEINEMFLDRNILHKAANSDAKAFEILFNLFKNHTNLEKQKSALKQAVVEDGWLRNEREYDSIQYSKLKCYGYPQVTILQTSLISFDPKGNSKTFKLIVEIYENYFNNSEIQEMILGSSLHMPYIVYYCNVESCQNIAQYFKKIFSGNEELLNDFLLQSIEQTNKNIFQYFEDFGDIRDQLNAFRDVISVII